MIEVKSGYLELNGSNYEIGQKLGRMAAAIPPLKAYYTSGGSHLADQDIAAAKQLFDHWCPGLNAELQGFTDALGVHQERSPFYAMTYLKPRCSQIALLPGLTDDGHVRLARSYEFSHQAEDFILARTSVRGKYTHLGSSVMLMGRDEGMNECGLGVSMSSCGFPVGALETMRNPALRGLQFWAVIRTLLENCRDVDTALSFMADMPIAYNINLVLADKSGQAALVETLDGRRAVRRIDNRGIPKCLFATNHGVFAELKKYEPKAMRNSLVRYEYLQGFMHKASGITMADLRALLLRRYPEGLCFHYYDDYMGTTKSLIMDLTSGELDVCWGGLESNGWQTRPVSQPLDDSQQFIRISLERARPELFEMVDY